MALTFNSSSQGLRLPFGDLQQPCSMAIWFRDTNGTNNDRNMFQIADTSVSSRLFRLSVTGANAIRFVNSWGTGVDTDSTTTYSTNVWNHALVTVPATNETNIWLNNGGIGTNSTDTGTVANIDEIALGYENDSSPGDTWIGDLAECGIWNVELTEASRIMLAAGVSPRFVQPESLVYYAPCVRDKISIMGENSGVMTDTAANVTVSEHPRIIYPYSPRINTFAVAAPAGGRIMSSLANNGGLAGMGGLAGKGGGLAG